jgi:hypothetical protein
MLRLFFKFKFLLSFHAHKKIEVKNNVSNNIMDMCHHYKCNEGSPHRLICQNLHDGGIRRNERGTKKQVGVKRGNQSLMHTK